MFTGANHWTLILSQMNPVNTLKPYFLRSILGKLAQAVLLLTCTLEVPSLNSGDDENV
jgi:hypothetical protein